MISRFCAVLTLGLATMAPSLFATTVGATYSGTEKSCFGGDTCNMVSTATSYGLIGKDLTFTPDSFNRVGNGDVTLGTFSLTPGFSLFSGDFNMDVTFSAPAGTNGAGTFDAELGGFVFFDLGGAEITFNKPTTDVYTYPGGSFSLSLDKTSFTLCPGSSADLTATITNTSAAPEPTAMLLMGSGLGLLGLARFRKTVKA